MGRTGYYMSIVGICAMSLGGYITSIYIERPTGAYSVDLNGDGKPDLVLKNQSRKDIGYLLAIGNGEYMSVEEMKKQGLRMIEADIKSKKEEEMKMFREGWEKIEKTIEDKLKIIQ